MAEAEDTSTTITRFEAQAGPRAIPDLTEDEVKMVQAAFGRLRNADKKEKVIGAFWVAGSFAGKTQSGTFALGITETRIAYMKKEKKKFEVKEWGHLFLLKLVGSKSPRQLEITLSVKAGSADVMYWREFDLFPEDHITKIVHCIFETYQDVTYGNPTIDLKQKFRLNPPERKNRFPLPKEEPALALAGFIAAYKCYAGIHNLPPDRNVLKFLRSSSLVTKKQKLTLTDISDLDRPGYNFVPIFGALRYNRWFKTLLVKGLPPKNTLFQQDNLLRVLEKNDSLDGIVLNNVDGASGDFVACAAALSKNFVCKVALLDFSDNKVEDKGLIALAGTFKKLDIRSLKFSNCELSAKGVKAAYQGILENVTAPSNVQTLNFGKNKLGGKAAKDFDDFLHDLYLLQEGKLEAKNKAKSKKKKKGEEEEKEAEPDQSEVKPINIKTLQYADCGLDLEAFFAPLIELRHVYPKIARLDISGNKFNPKKDLEPLCEFLKETDSLCALDISKMPGMTIQHVGTVLDSWLLQNTAFFKEDPIEDAFYARKLNVEISLSGIDLSAKMYNDEDVRVHAVDNPDAPPIEAALFLKVLTESGRIRDLRMQGCKLGNENLLKILLALSGKEFFFKMNISGNNLTKPGSKKTAEFIAEELGPAMKAIPNLTQLGLSGEGGKKYDRADLRQFYDIIAEMESMVEIDVSSNQVGDGGMKDLADLVRRDPTLMIVNFDNNGPSIDGLKVLRDAVASSNSICRMPFPQNDVTSIAQKHPKQVDALGEVVAAMQKQCGINRSGGKSKKKRDAGDDDDDDDGEEGGEDGPPKTPKTPHEGDEEGGERGDEDEDKDKVGEFPLPVPPEGGLPNLAQMRLQRTMNKSKAGMSIMSASDAEIARRFGKKKVSALPPEMKSAVSYILDKGLETEYIFKGEYDEDVVIRCLDTLEMDPGADISEDIGSPHNMAALLMQWLERQHNDDPLVPQEIYDQCITANFMPGVDGKTNFLKNTFGQLEPRNKAILRYVYLLLNKIDAAPDTYMDARELASVFRHVLLCSPNEGSGFGDQMEIDLITLAIEQAEAVFAKS